MQCIALSCSSHDHITYLILFVNCDFRNLPHCLSEFIKFAVKDRRTLDFILVLPLFHFLSGLTEPYKAGPSVSHQTPYWWGFSDAIKDVAEQAKNIRDK
jgi:hypothetical protein